MEVKLTPEVAGSKEDVAAFLKQAFGNGVAPPTTSVNLMKPNEPVPSLPFRRKRSAGTAIEVFQSKVSVEDRILRLLEVLPSEAGDVFTVLAQSGEEGISYGCLAPKMGAKGDRMKFARTIKAWYLKMASLGLSNFFSTTVDGILSTRSISPSIDSVPSTGASSSAEDSDVPDLC